MNSKMQALFRIVCWIYDGIYFAHDFHKIFVDEIQLRKLHALLLFPLENYQKEKLSLFLNSRWYVLETDL